MLKTLVLLILVIGVPFTITAFQVVAPPETLCDALALLGTQTFISMGIGALVALLVEYWPAWEGLPPKSKRPFIFAFCLVAPVILIAGQYTLCGVVVTQDTIYLALLAGFAAFTGSTFAHIKKLPSR